MGPGPSCVPEAVYAALREPTIGHLDPVFLQLMDDLRRRLKRLFLCPEGALALPLSGTGSSGMEAAMVNLLEPGDRILILANGVFGERMKDVASRLGAEVESLDFAWGTPVAVDAVAAHLPRARPYKMVAVVHAETSTGVANPVEAIGRVLDEMDPRPLYLVDAVTSLGGMPIDMKSWGIDEVYSGTQKCLACPPGLAPFALSAAAMAASRSRKTKVPNWYLDVSMLIRYWESGEGGARVYHHTAPINMLYGLHAAVGLILDEGLAAVHRRHNEAHQRLREGIAATDWSFLVEPEFRLPMLNALRVPAGIEEAPLRRKLRTDCGIEVGPGLGAFAGKVWRVGLMGHTARPENVDRFLHSLQSL